MEILTKLYYNIYILHNNISNTNLYDHQLADMRYYKYCCWGLVDWHLTDSSNQDDTILSYLSLPLCHSNSHHHKLYTDPPETVCHNEWQPSKHLFYFDNNIEKCHKRGTNIIEIATHTHTCTHTHTHTERVCYW